MSHKHLFHLIHSKDIQAFEDELEKLRLNEVLPETVTLPKTGDSLLHVISQVGNCDMMKTIFEKFPKTNIQCQNFEGKTLLHEAAQFCQSEIIQLLIDNMKE